MNDPVSLSIGAIGGGPGTDRRWKDAVMALMRSVVDTRESVASPLALNVVYQIPGQNLTPDFEGTRSGLFSRKNRELMVQVALPPTPDESAEREVRRYLLDAVLLAEDFAQQEGLLDGELTARRQLAALI